MTDPDTAHPQTLPFLKAWDDYVAACQPLFERLNDRSAANLGAPVPLGFLGPWKDFATSLGMRSDFSAGEHFKAEDMFASHMPALGYSREYQEIGQRMLDLSGQFQRRYAEFAKQGAEIGQGALQAIQKRSASDETLRRSPTALYDAWIDSAEEAYARAAHSVEFARLLADLCNILSAFRIERGKMLEALARHLDWPSRTEVDSLHRQVRILTSAAAKTTAAAKTAERATRPDKPKRRKASKRAGK